MKTYKKLFEVLKMYGVVHHESYYLSTGKFIEEFPKEPFRTDFYAVCICKSGEILLEADGVEYVITQNHFFVSAPSTVISFSHTKKNFEMRLLLFEKNFVTKHSANPYLIESLGIFKNSAFGVYETNKEDFSRLYRTMTYLEQISSRTGKFIEEIIITVILYLLLEIAEITTEEYQETRADESKNILVQFRELVQKNSIRNKEVSYYADRLNISNKYLIRVIKRASGMTPHEIIDENILKESFVLLADPRKDISEIAFEVGFNSVSAFGRFFKKHTDLSPSEYRLKHL